jgi:hypothetical protein
VIGNIVRWGIAVGLVGLSLANASWITPKTEGAMQLIAGKPEGGNCLSVEDVRKALIAGGGPVLLGGAEGCTAREEALTQLGRYAFVFQGGDPVALLATFDKLKRPFELRHAFIGSADEVAAFRKAAPGGWAFTIAEARKCYDDYAVQGWLTIVPESCRNGTMLVPLDGKWKLAGWPKRFQARMKAAGTRVILTAPGAPADAIPGLSSLDQIPEIPRDYAGYVWVDDIELIGRSIQK